MNVTTIASWALRILSLIPLIASGIHQTKSDLDLKGKQAAAQDAFQIAAASAQVLLPAEHQELAAKITAVASDTLDATLAALHNPAPVPAA